MHKIKLKKTGKAKVDDMTCMLGDVNDVASYFGDTVLKNTQTRVIAEDMIKHAITFILHKDHVTTVSWGDKQFMLGPDEIVTLPRL